MEIFRRKNVRNLCPSMLPSRTSARPDVLDLERIAMSDHRHAEIVKAKEGDNKVVVEVVVALAAAHVGLLVTTLVCLSFHFNSRNII
jgi:hypothetical protein